VNKKKPPSRVDTVIYGVHPVVETIKAGKRRVEELLWTGGSAGERELAELIRDASFPVTRISAQDIRSVTGSLHHQGVAARVGPFPYVDVEDVIADRAKHTGPVVVLDEIQDPGNLGNILRSVECLGGGAVILPRDRAVGVTPAVEKSAAGASAYVAVARATNLSRVVEQLKDSGFWVFAAEARAESTCYETDLTGAIAFVLGSEGKGIRRLVREKCDRGISIPMKGRIDSLNVSQTAAVLLAEVLRQRHGGGPGSSSGRDG
jgi:23S rRNA (guanosine2251-2'-O)-methyltransferase